jgi:hypothetical protein
MKKRFTDIQIWEAPWFRKLNPDSKLFWYFITSRCDDAGIWEIDEEAFAFYSKVETPFKELVESLGDRTQYLSDTHLWIKKFVEFQYGELSETAKPHQPAIRSLRKYGLFKGSTKPLEAIKDKDTEKDKDKEKEKDIVCRSVIAKYHQILPSLKSCKSLGSKRKRAILARFNQVGEIEKFDEIFHKVAKSDFLLGKIKDWSATLDWIMKLENWEKIDEDIYDSQKPQPLTQNDHARGFSGN